MLMDDSIAILNYNRCSMLDYDIWVLIQPGVWNKLFTFECIRLIKSCYDRSLIFADKASRLVSYNVRTKTTRHLGFQHTSLGIGAKCSGCGVFYYKESLVKLTQRDD
ncbi:hypothetical protein MTR67_048805 [Solanum verrucosum]|uniref:Uncharacterized protein n=1 Tax=Solanum verrucosum TaxID=315347 RepID=A0AAF0UZ44_SOLVR|nr:hypothetical protein MTR67_048805 [Solanum verrucosum]